uniref:Uncharacterized protein n=1 Tax=Arundo donax TaxID=35708 RepID=A0A0A8YBZ3_ARUDO
MDNIAQLSNLRCDMESPHLPFLIISSIVPSCPYFPKIVISVRSITPSTWSAFRDGRPSGSRIKSSRALLELIKG